MLILIFIKVQEVLHQFHFAARNDGDLELSKLHEVQAHSLINEKIHRYVKQPQTTLSNHLSAQKNNKRDSPSIKRPRKSNSRKSQRAKYPCSKAQTEVHSSIRKGATHNITAGKRSSSRVQTKRMNRLKGSPSASSPHASTPKRSQRKSFLRCRKTILWESYATEGLLSDSSAINSSSNSSQSSSADRFDSPSSSAEDTYSKHQQTPTNGSQTTQRPKYFGRKSVKKKGQQKSIDTPATSLHQMPITSKKGVKIPSKMDGNDKSAKDQALEALLLQKEEKLFNMARQKHKRKLHAINAPTVRKGSTKRTNLKASSKKHRSKQKAKLVEADDTVIIPYAYASKRQGIKPMWKHDNKTSSHSCQLTPLSTSHEFWSLATNSSEVKSKIGGKTAVRRKTRTYRRKRTKMTNLSTFPSLDLSF